ncbi:hypothetical protein CRG98_035273 [Punica granatum]|uniref:Aminotransferase-like plant mobile domain-containing protein n=1 Tax=Punica granatum TaxID=22663 RepID=A0A2I0IK15_PUNGR|nr:hypothetical protein CRG98_035273 [Punica granatum]
MRIWRTLRPVDHAFIRGIIGDMVMFTETSVDWIFLRTAMEFWDPEHAVFNFQGTELALTIEEYMALIQRSTSTTQGIFVPNPFATIRSQLSSLLGIRTQDIHEELHQGWDHGIRIAWLSDWTLLRALTPSTASYQRDASESSIQAAMRVELRAITEERDRLRCELVDSCAEVADYRELQTELARARARVAHLDREMARLSARLDRVQVITTGVAPLSDYSTTQDGGRGSSRYLRRSQPTGSGPFSTTSDARSTASDSYRHTPGEFGRPSDTSPAPDVFRGAPSTSSADVVYLRRPSPHHGTGGHGQPNGRQHGRTARPA